MASAENGKRILFAEDEQPVRTFVLAMSSHQAVQVSGPNHLKISHTHLV